MNRNWIDYDYPNSEKSNANIHALYWWDQLKQLVKTSWGFLPIATDAFEHIIEPSFKSKVAGICTWNKPYFWQLRPVNECLIWSYQIICSRMLVWFGFNPVLVNNGIIFCCFFLSSFLCMLLFIYYLWDVR